MFTFVLFDNIKTCNLNCIDIGKVKLNILLEVSVLVSALVLVHHYLLSESFKSFRTSEIVYMLLLGSFLHLLK